MPAVRRTSGFEPPPWEREAFEEFKRHEVEAALRSELDETLRDTLRLAEARASQKGTAITQGDAVVGSRDVGREALPPEAVESMLIELRAEEPAMPAMRPLFAHSVSVMLAVGGVVLVVGGSKLFLTSRVGPAAASLLSGVASLAVLLIGVCLMAAGVVLFRKYQQ